MRPSILLVIYKGRSVAGQKLSREERERIAAKRLVANLDALTVANMRTLEMKIADSGPSNLRVNPHIITTVRNGMIKRKAILQLDKLWYHRAIANPEAVQRRLELLRPLHQRTNDRHFTIRLGQTLEIAIFRSLGRSQLNFVGGFPDLGDHDDSTLYSKEEPPLSFSGRRMPGDMRFDFLIFHPVVGPLGVEAKNIREWIYPNRSEVKELLYKAVTADTVPILIGRRIPYVTFLLLNTCGVMAFENLNQLYPLSDAILAADVRAKENLGYHDVREGNEPNERLLNFIGSYIIREAEEYRERFDRYKDLLLDFATGEISYASFAARIRRRRTGQPEDSDEPPEPDWPEHPDDYDSGWP
jgi:hypothetical protein